jgi:hypothetical protein
VKMSIVEKERKYLKMKERETREESKGRAITRLARISPVGQQWREIHLIVNEDCCSPRG